MPRVYINTIIYANLMPFLILIIFIWMIHYNPVFNKRQEKLFLLAAWTDVGMIIAISIDYLILRNEFVDLWMVRKFASFLNFAISPMIPLLLYKISNSEDRSKKFYLPFIINFTICFISLFNGVVSSISRTNTYARGPLFLLPFLTVFAYILLLFFKRTRYYLKGKNAERIFLLFVIIMLLIGMILEIGYSYAFMSWISASLCLPLYYLLLNINHAILDPLTGVYNRLMYNKQIESIRGKKTCTLILIDINNFKEVNDTFGHEAGDRYLQQFVELLGDQLQQKAYIYRVGGDEFMLLSLKTSMNEIVSQVELAKQIANQKQMDFAFGAAWYEPSMQLEEVLQLVDERMYAHKKQCKQKIA